MKKPVIKQKVTIVMPGVKIEGDVSVPEGLRVSDFLNGDSNMFVSVVDAKLYDWKGDYIEDRKYIAVNKDKINYLLEK